MSLPTAQQFDVVGHDRSFTYRNPGGRIWLAHVAPPLVVEITTPFPIAQHADMVGHDTVLRLAVALGNSWAVQVTPASEVARTTPFVVIWLYPTVQHCVVVGHETPVSNDAKPVGNLWAVQVRPPSAVAATTPTGLKLWGAATLPTAQQAAAVGHDMSAGTTGDSQLGSAWDVHLAPPFVVLAMAAPTELLPITQQSVAVEQETPTPLTKIEGSRCCKFQDAVGVDRAGTVFAKAGMAWSVSVTTSTPAASTIRIVLRPVPVVVPSRRSLQLEESARVVMQAVQTRHCASYLVGAAHQALSRSWRSRWARAVIPIRQGPPPARRSVLIRRRVCPPPRVG
jgi:hypothetical protein